MCFPATFKGYYPATVKQYTTSFVLKAGIDPFAERFYLIKDKFRREWFGQAVTDAEGNTTFTVDVHPYIFSQYAGKFLLFLVGSDKKPVDLTFGENVCKCVAIQFADIRDEFNNPHNVIQ